MIDSLILQYFIISSQKAFVATLVFDSPPPIFPQCGAWSQAKYKMCEYTRFYC